MGTDGPLTYWDYIRVEDLLDLQGGVEDDEVDLANEEVVFITVHQVFELWFKLVLRELRTARDLFCRDVVANQELSGAARSLDRVITILGRATDHFLVMETLSTRDYLAFRDKLTTASGFQSAQMRELEIVLGLDSAERIDAGPAGNWLEMLRNHDGSESWSSRRVLAALNERHSLKEAIERWLARTPIDGVAHDDPDAETKLGEFIANFLQAHAREADSACDVAIAQGGDGVDPQARRLRAEKEKEAVRAFFEPSEEEGGIERARIRCAMMFIETYRELPLLAWPREVLDKLVEAEQAFVLFRQRHARMVERIIGRRTGTGGSSGVDYLDAVAQTYRVFRDLWAIRTLQIRREAAPPLANPDYYGFAHDA
ncbi:MAG: tryptophan 2,3-dioxygenase family protein [Planctomycetota bacterium]|jgi:tryptophan 2,3-dioxygenase|nr:tryptophan 2,3-dioxygenase family protein [Planctomycetota bacterium]MDP6761236.1 tryptophan 2,3-dioxygenase family protein [Planctomycetota bacterium]MDP6988376.1 tryptophan 2,3-dioxygenase family protein [Planctomycetota bacterium]